MQIRFFVIVVLCFTLSCNVNRRTNRNYTDGVITEVNLEFNSGMYNFMPKLMAVLDSQLFVLSRVPNELYIYNLDGQYNKKLDKAIFLNEQIYKSITTTDTLYYKEVKDLKSDSRIHDLIRFNQVKVTNSDVYLMGNFLVPLKKRMRYKGKMVLAKTYKPFSFVSKFDSGLQLVKFKFFEKKNRSFTKALITDSIIIDGRDFLASKPERPFAIYRDNGDILRVVGRDSIRFLELSKVLSTTRAEEYTMDGRVKYGNLNFQENGSFVIKDSFIYKVNLAGNKISEIDRFSEPVIFYVQEGGAKLVVHGKPYHTDTTAMYRIGKYVNGNFILIDKLAAMDTSLPYWHNGVMYLIHRDESDYYVRKYKI